MAVTKALAILRLAATGPSVGPTSVAKVLHVDKSTGSRLIRTLTDEGFLTPQDDGRGWCLGPAVLELAASIHRRIDLQQLALDEMTRLRDLTGETVSLQTRVGNIRVCVAQVPSLHPIRWVIEVGESRPLTAGSSAKILLAGMPIAELRRLLQRAQFNRFTPHTLGRDELLAEVNSVRMNGYAINDGERVDGVSGLAVPLRNSSSETIGALAVSGPQARWTRSRMMEYLNAVSASAARISARISNERGIASASRRGPQERE